MSNKPQLLDFAIWLMHHSQHFLYLHQTKTFPKLSHVLRKFMSLANFTQDSVGRKVNLLLFGRHLGRAWEQQHVIRYYATMLLPYNPLITTYLLFFILCNYE